MFLLTLLLIHCRAAHVSFFKCSSGVCQKTDPADHHDQGQDDTFLEVATSMTDDKLVLAALSKVMILMFSQLHKSILTSITSLHFPGPICLGVSKRRRKQEDNCYSGKTWRKRCLQISHHEKERNRQDGSTEHIFKSQQAFAKVCSYLISPDIFRSSIHAGKTQHCVFFNCFQVWP